MSGKNSFADLRKGMSSGAQAEAEALFRQLNDEMELAEVRKALKLSQEELAQTLQIGQSSVAKLEKRADMYVGTLRRFIEAMGGELEITARFKGRTVKIRNFGDLSEPK